VNKAVKTATSATQFALLHAYSVQLQLPAAQAQTKTLTSVFNKLA